MLCEALKITKLVFYRFPGKRSIQNYNPHQKIISPLQKNHDQVGQNRYVFGFQSVVGIKPILVLLSISY